MGGPAQSAASRIVIFGNSSSGKSTLAHALSEQHDLAHLDLDTVAWEPVSPPRRRPIAQSQRAIDVFTGEYPRWVIEGCYADLLEYALQHADEVIFLDLPVQSCIDNARKRPWEPHKYSSPEAQDANLQMLIDWIRQYEERDDLFSRAAHAALFERFEGAKTRYSEPLPIQS